MLPSFLVFVWLVVTVLHFAFSWCEFGKLTEHDDSATADDRLFGLVLGGIGSLSVVLHVLAATVGVGLWRVTLALVAWHAGAQVVVRFRPDAPPPARLRGLEWAALVAAVGIILSWLDWASGALIVTGTDAAHYHVPVAVNIALGARLFDLPATPHLYPVAGSVFGAWFLIPTGSTLLIDLSMCLPFALFWASANVLFRRLTNASGLAWVTWLVLMLFSLPLFRSSSLVSADLWFASSVAALVAALVSAWTLGDWRLRDVILVALAAGLTAGTKTTGLPVAIVIVGLTAIVTAWRRRLWDIGQWRAGRASARLAVGLALFVGSGGIWLIRNWVLFGSPLAPMGVQVFSHTIFAGDPWQPTDYLSVLGDMQHLPNYDLAWQANRYARVWLGPWWGFVFVPLLVLMVDLAAGWRRGAARVYSARALALVLILVSGAILTKTLIASPWTSLEWTRGLSLRYLLPWIALVPVLSYVALFPVTWRWHDNPTIATAVAMPIIAISLVMFWSALAPNLPRSSAVPPATLTWLAVASGSVGFARLTRLFEPRTREWIALALILAGCACWAPTLAARDTRAVANAHLAEQQEFEAWLANPVTAAAHRSVYLAALDAERSTGEPCRARRFFAIPHFDEPMTLQPPTLAGSRVYYAGWDNALLAGRPPLARCDYVITTAALRATDKGAEAERLLRGAGRLEVVGPTSTFVLLAAR